MQHSPITTLMVLLTSTHLINARSPTTTADNAISSTPSSRTTSGESTLVLTGSSPTTTTSDSTITPSATSPKSTPVTLLVLASAGYDVDTLSPTYFASVFRENESATTYKLSLPNSTSTDTLTSPSPSTLSSSELHELLLINGPSTFGLNFAHALSNPTSTIIPYQTSALSCTHPSPAAGSYACTANFYHSGQQRSDYVTDIPTESAQWVEVQAVITGGMSLRVLPSVPPVGGDAQRGESSGAAGNARSRRPSVLVGVAVLAVAMGMIGF